MPDFQFSESSTPPDSSAASSGRRFRGTVVSESKPDSNPQGQGVAANSFCLPADARLTVKLFRRVVWHVLFRQQAIFGAPFEGKWDRRALAFAMMVTALVPLLEQALLVVLLPFLNIFLPDSVPMIAVVGFLPVRLSVMELIRDAFVLPLLIPVPLALYAALLHVLLRLAQSGERGYAVTLQTVCFALACWLFSIIPGSGGAVAVIWWLGVLTAGLRYAHGSPWHRVLPVMALHVSAVAWLVCTAYGWVLLPF